MSKFVEMLDPILTQMALDALRLLENDGFLPPNPSTYGGDAKRVRGCYTASISFHPRSSGIIDVSLYALYSQTPTEVDPKINLDVPEGFDFTDPDLSIGRERVAVHGTMNPHLVNDKGRALEGLANLQRQIWDAVRDAKPDTRNSPDKRYLESPRR